MHGFARLPAMLPTAVAGDRQAVAARRDARTASCLASFMASIVAKPGAPNSLAGTRHEIWTRIAGQANNALSIKENG
jgi:hypothetical protein